MTETTRGTRGQFTSWLSSKKHMTYTAYSRLEPTVKKAIYAEYKPRRKKA